MKAIIYTARADLPELNAIAAFLAWQGCSAQVQIADIAKFKGLTAHPIVELSAHAKLNGYWELIEYWQKQGLRRTA